MNRSMWTRRPRAVTIGCALGVSFSMGPFFANAFPIFLPYMAESTGWGRTAISSANSIVAAGGALGSPFVGILLDRYGGRRVVLVGVLLAGLSIALFAATPPSYPGYLTIVFLAAAVVSLSTPAPFVYVLSQWHERRLGVALGVCMAMLNVASIGTAALAHFVIESYSWRVGWLVLGLVMIVGGLLNGAFLIHDRPREPLPSAATALAEVSTSARTILRRPSFWLQALSFPCVLLATAGITIHGGAIMLDRGYSGGLATAAVASIFGASIVGRLATGWILDRGIPYHVLGACLFPLVGVAAMMLFFGLGGWAPAIAFLIVGLVNGAETDILPYALRKNYGQDSFGRLFGISFALCLLGPIFGSILMGAAFDLQGSYGTALIVLAAAAALSGLMLAAARKMAVREEGKASPARSEKAHV